MIIFNRSEIFWSPIQYTASQFPRQHSQKVISVAFGEEIIGNHHFCIILSVLQ